MAAHDSQPLMQPVNPLPQPPAADAIVVDSAKANILVVDDRRDKLLTFRATLEGLNENLVMLQSGEEALRWLLENECAVILLDVDMPGLDGFETAHLIRTRPRSSHIPIIFITGYADETHTARGYSLGAVDYILSPMVPNILRSKVAVFVQLFKLTQQARMKADEHIALVREQAARAAAEAASRRTSFIASASKLLSSSLDVDSLMAGATRLLVPALADFSAVTLVGPPGPASVRSACAQGLNAEGLHHAIVHDPLWVGAINEALATGQRKFVGEASADARNSGLRTGKRPAARAGGGRGGIEQMVMLPLVVRGKTHGVLSLGFGYSGKRFDNGETGLASDIAGRLAMALDNCLLFKKIQEADKRKNEFLATLSHELRNPLAPMRTALHAAQLAGVWPAEGRALREMLERQVEHMTRLVDDLLDLTRISQGKIHLRKEQVELTDKIMSVLETCRPPIEAAGLKLRVSVPRKKVWVEGDRVRLHQIFGNLLTNAGRYTKAGGRVDVSLSTEAGEAVIRIRDTGVGIAADMQPKIWEMFMQADADSDQTRSGLGIGLSLARQLVQLHAGRIGVSSEGLGKGSEFTVRLPLATAARAETAVAKPVAAAKAEVSITARRILIVDDNADAADSLGVLLGIWGHEVKIVHSGAMALQVAHGFDPELIFLDIGLPEMNGYEVARRLREDAGLARAKYVALSGYGTDRARQKSRAAGFDLHLVKPADPRTLSAAIESLLAVRP
jgi:signal transduction histidine kinase/DNA-binding response OmpR family regulator